MTISLPRTLLLSAFLLIPCAILNSRQATAVQRIPQFENGDVRVWKSVVTPHGPLTMHTHQHPRVIIALTGGTMKVQYESGASELHQWEAGKAYWLSAEEGKARHADVNEGTKPIEVMVVEVKGGK
jgi:quercetin dioxygenase-like cupin family protein